MPPTDGNSKFGDLVAVSSTSRLRRMASTAALQLHFELLLKDADGSDSSIFVTFPQKVR